MKNKIICLFACAIISVILFGCAPKAGSYVNTPTVVAPIETQAVVATTTEVIATPASTAFPSAVVTGTATGSEGLVTPGGTNLNETPVAATAENPQFKVCPAENAADCQLNSFDEVKAWRQWVITTLSKPFPATMKRVPFQQFADEILFQTSTAPNFTTDKADNPVRMDTTSAVFNFSVDGHTYSYWLKPEELGILKIRRVLATG